MSERYRIFTGDCLDVMRRWKQEQLDAVVCDPPAGIEFMGADWDSDRGGMEEWVAWLAERLTRCYQLLKPGGHALVWALPRTSFWTGLAIHKSGFEIRDRVSHLFGTGFPKGGLISKNIDKKLGYEPTIIGENPNHRPVSGVEYEGIYQGGNTGSKHLTAPTSPEAKQWDGWGSALKPVCEDWWLARKPFKGSLVSNVLERGTGALNVEACRIPTDDKLTRKLGKTTESDSGWKSVNRSEIAGKDGGRWPANVVIDDEVAELLGEDVSRFFYCAKPTKKERSAGLPEGETNKHPTVKSVTLMRWLVRLVTPPDGVVLDPFMGSGSTGVACMLEGFRFVGVELDQRYTEIARSRIEYAHHQAQWETE